MGCNTCRSECGREDGCGSRKAAQQVLLDGLIRRLYPGRTWGQPDDAACFRAGLGPFEVGRLRRALAEALCAPTYVRPGGPDDLCSFLYVLCLGREPPLIEIRDSEAGLGLLEVEVEGEVGAAAGTERLALRERYLRLSCSAIGRLVAVQEVALEMDVKDGLAEIREIPLPGVFDPKLLKRFQKAVDLVQAHEIEHLDMGLLDLPAERFGLQPGDYAERFGTEPGLFNFFFQAQPVKTASVSYLPI